LLVDGILVVSPALSHPRAVIPGWSEGPDPESRDSGFDASHRPGMTAQVASILAMKMR
jgi:DNA helicase-2/ATP-dependent DNA helicase PcrA